MLDSTRYHGDATSTANEDVSLLPDPAVVFSRLRSRKRMATGILCASMTALTSLGVLYFTIKPTTYTAAASLLVSNTGLQLSGTDAVVTQMMVENSMIQSQIEVLKSDKIASGAASILGEDVARSIATQQIGFLGSLRERLSSLEAPQPAAEGRQLVGRLKSKVSISRVGPSQILEVAATTAEPASAAKLANAVVQSYLKDQAEANAVVSTSGFVREKIRAVGPSARVISDAAPPTQPSGLTLPVLILAGLLAGAGAGAIVVILMLLLTRTLRCAADARSQLGLECVLTPKKGRHATSHLISMRRLMALSSTLTNSSPKVIGITSPCAHQGAEELTQQFREHLSSAGARCVIVDARGLRDAVKGSQDRTVSFADSLNELGSALRKLRMSSVDHDWVLIQLPYLWESPDFRMGLSLIDGLVVAVPWGTSSRTVRESLDFSGLSPERLVCIVLNQSPATLVQPNCARS